MSYANRFVDWDLVDWNFPRFGLVNAALGHPINHVLTREEYERETAYDGPVHPVDLETFRALPAGNRQARRSVAEQHLHEAMALQRILWRSWEVWADSRRSAVAQEAFSYGGGLLTHALRHLQTAAGLDPENPFTWYHLATFRGYAGDRDRQRRALENGLLLLRDPSNEDEELTRLRMLVDSAWLARDEGRFLDGSRQVSHALELIESDELYTYDLIREAQLLEALLMVDRNEIPTARHAAIKLVDWSIPLQKTPAQSSTFAATVMSKHNLEKIDSDFAQNWVWALTYMKQGLKEPALAYMNKQQWSTEFPAHLCYRYWQDMGRVHEHFGHMRTAELCYAYAFMQRPMLPHYPKVASHGLSRIFDQAGTGRAYFLAYGSHFIAGSYFCWAANRLAEVEIAPTPLARVESGRRALRALDNCLAQGMRPATTLALRGRVHYRLGQRDEAEQDLSRAREMLAASGQDSPDVLKLLAVLRFDREDFASALELLRQYSELVPRDAFGWRLGGVCLAHLGRLDEARESLDVALDMDPQAGVAWYNRALVHLRLGNHERARQDLIFAQRLMPGHAEVARVAALVRDAPDTPIRMGSSRVSLEIDRADSLMFANVDRREDPDLTTGLGKKDLDRLMKSLKKRYEEEPTTSNRLALARSLVRTGQQREVQDLLGPLWPDQLDREEMKLLLRSDRALGRTRRAVRLAATLRHDPEPPRDGDLWALVALICLENGAPDAGRLALDQALALDPENVALLRMRHGDGR